MHAQAVLAKFSRSNRLRLSWDLYNQHYLKYPSDVWGGKMSWLDWAPGHPFIYRNIYTGGPSSLFFRPLRKASELIYAIVGE